MRNFEKWDWFIFALCIALVVVAVFTTWKILIISWPIYALAEFGDFIKRRRSNYW